MIAIRAEGNSKIGSGHVMRCLSIAKAAKKQGKDCTFVMIDTSLEKLVEDNGFKVIKIACDEDLLVLKEISEILIDNYAISKELIAKLCKVTNVYVMDDLMDRRFEADKIVNYNVYADSKIYSNLYGNSDTKMILGPAYAPLRDEFCNLPPKNIKKNCEEILILTGGADPEHVALRLATKAALIKENYHFSFVCGALSGDIDKLKNIEKENKNIGIYVNVKNMHELMQRADVTVSAAGSTAYELCACSTPFIVYVLANNQLRAGTALAEAGVAVYAGDARGDCRFEEGIFESIETLDKDFALRERISKKERQLVDGEGAKRLAEALFE